MSQMPHVGAPGGVLKPHRGTLILVFSILSWLICVLFGVFAWVMANKDLEEMANGQMDPEGESMTKAGKIIAMISVILSIVGIVLGGLFFLIFVVFAAAAGASGA